VYDGGRERMWWFVLPGQIIGHGKERSGTTGEESNVRFTGEKRA
jgi:hypothetical protein